MKTVELPIFLDTLSAYRYEIRKLCETFNAEFVDMDLKSDKEATCTINFQDDRDSACFLGEVERMEYAYEIMRRLK